MALLCSTVLFTLSCAGAGNNPPQDSDGNASDGGDNSGGNNPGGEDSNDDNNNTGGGTEDGGNKNDSGDTPTIVVPVYREYDRATVPYEKITYKRPDMDAVKADIDAVIRLIQNNTVSFKKQLDGIYSLEDGYTDVLTMRAYADVQTQKNAADTFWAGEYEYIEVAFSSFSQKIEELYVAAANSPHAQRFEEEYFGEGLIEEYRGGGIYTDRVVELMEEESALCAAYSALSTATVVIKYLDMTDTVDNILAYYADKYGDNSVRYLSVKTQCMVLYDAACDEKTQELLVSLFQVRRLIANELGYDSYAPFAYASMGHDYSEAEAEAFIDSICDIIEPVYELLYSLSGLNSTPAPKTDRVTLINTLYDVYGELDAGLSEAYSFMLQFNLYDIAPDGQNRYEGAFTTYFDAYDAPYLFVTTNGNVMDFTTLAHEFGHFYDAYINFGSDSSLDLSEVSSQGLELLTMHALSKVLDEDATRYLWYSEMISAMEVLLYQGFYAAFEMEAYKIPYDEITQESLDAAVARAAAKFNMSEQVNSLWYVCIPHIVLYPFYVQSYCTSVVAALSVYYMEVQEEGAGLAAYKALIDRQEENTFVGYLEAAGIASPFDKKSLMNIANLIYYDMTGAYLYKESQYAPDAA